MLCMARASKNKPTANKTYERLESLKIKREKLVS